MALIVGIVLIIIGQCAGCSHNKKVQLYQKYSPDCCGMNSDSPAFIYQRTHYCATVEEMKEYRRLYNEELKWRQKKWAELPDHMKLIK